MKQSTVRDIDAQSWRANPFVEASPEQYSVLSSGAYHRVVKVPITQDRRVCLARHQLLKADKYRAAFSSGEFLQWLEAPTGPLLQDGVFFNGTGSHWHFLIDGLGTFHTVGECERKTLFVDADVSDEQIGFVLDFALKAGFRRFRDVQRLSGTCFRVSNCTFYCRQRFTQKVHRIRSVLGLGESRSSSGHKRFFVLRNKAPMRRLLNQDRIGALLQERFAFRVVDPSAMSLAEQALTFRDAQVVVGPHGAGLANAIFASKLAMLVEIFHSEPQIFYHSLCYALGARHHAIVGARISEGVADSTRLDNADYIADEDIVLRALDALLSGNERGPERNPARRVVRGESAS